MAKEPEKITPPKKADKIYVIAEPGGFTFKGKSYQEHERYSLTKLKEMGWQDDDIKAAHRMLKEAQDA